MQPISTPIRCDNRHTMELRKEPVLGGRRERLQGDPGIVHTRLRARAVPGGHPSRLPPPDSVTEAFLALALPECARNGEIVAASAVSSGSNE
jgi:hypothetical protein